MATRVVLDDAEGVTLPSRRLDTPREEYNTGTPRKIRELIRDLRVAGFTDRGGKGDHRNLEHPKGIRVTISGGLGDDALPYQERAVRQAIEEATK